MGIMEGLIVNYLKIFYPIKRIKDGNRFKRAIIGGGVSYSLSNKTSVKMLYNHLFDELMFLFAENKSTIETILKKFLDIK
jgi:hypothetical protein